MSLAIQVWFYECCSNVPPKIASKVVNRILRLLNWKTIAPHPRFEFLMNVMFNDNGKDPPSRKINEHSKKKQKVDSSTPVAKKPLMKKQVNEHTQMRTPAPRAAKGDGMKTPVFKPIPIRQALLQKRRKKSKQLGLFFLSLNAYQIQSIIIHPSANHQEEHEILDAKTSETVTEDHDQMNRGITDLSSNSLVNSEVELAIEEQVRTPPNTQEHINVCLYYLRKKSKYGPHSSYKNEPNKSYKYSTVDCNFMNVIRSLNDVYSMDHQNLNVGGQEHHLIEYINGFRMHAAVLWHTVKDIFILVNIKEKHHWVLAVLSFSERCIFLYDSYEFSGHYAAVLSEIEKIATIIPLCLQACDFYVKKEIDLQNHPRYKDKESSDMFDVLFEDDLPQQPSGSLDCGVFMIMYAECLSYSHKVIVTEFDPNALRTRYAALLWDYGIRKQEPNVTSDVEAPLRPARQSRITSVTEAVYV
ncbi:hypothetical protein T459_25051 [Capsicum annuum]|uniref:Ubiquitin-like protease family profile domain-containing protein n=1 Tax=Capsicum annuum TaxID=4072 RepID=A0A2G2YJN3_CAPAN|nr:hypothetical protein T459_25051 [Capsicum annuum]